MEILLVLIPLSIVLIVAGVAAFVWAVRDGQFENLDAEAARVLDDEGPPPDSRSDQPPDHR